MDAKPSEPPKARPVNRANDLDGKSWQRNSISIWSNIRKTSEEISPILQCSRWTW